MQAAPEQVAEAVYLHDDKGDCWTKSFKNGQIGLVNGSYAILPNGTKVGSTGDTGLLTADSEGENIRVFGYVYLESGEFHLSDIGSLPDSADYVVLCDASGKDWAQMLGDRTNFSAEYDAGTRTFSSVQGEIWLTIAEGKEEPENKYRIYKFNEGNKTVEIYDLTGWSEENAVLLAVCSCSDWSLVTLQAPEDVSSVEDISCIIDGTAIRLTEGAVTLPKGKTITIGTTEYTAAADGTGLAYNGGKAKLTAGTVALDKDESVTIGTTDTTIQPVSGNGVQVALTDGKYTLSGIGDGEKVSIGDKTYLYHGNTKFLEECTETYTNGSGDGYILNSAGSITFKSDGKLDTDTAATMPSSLGENGALDQISRAMPEGNTYYSKRMVRGLTRRRLLPIPWKRRQVALMSWNLRTIAMANLTLMSMASPI